MKFKTKKLDKNLSSRSIILEILKYFKQRLDESILSLTTEFNFNNDNASYHDS